MVPAACRGVVKTVRSVQRIFTAPVNMVDTNSIIEGTVKFRDGKKVCTQMFSSIWLCSSCNACLCGVVDTTILVLGQARAGRLHSAGRAKRNEQSRGRRAASSRRVKA